MAELSIKIKLQAFDEVSSRFANIIETSSRLSAKLADNQEKLKALNQQSRSLQAFDALKQKANTTAGQLNQTRQKVRQLHQELQKGSAGRSAKQMNQLRQQYERTRRSADSLERTHSRQRQRLAGLNSELRQAGVNTGRFRQEQQRLEQSSKTLIATLERQNAKLKARATLSGELKNAHNAHSQRLQKANTIGAVGQKVSLAGAAVVGGVGMGMRQLINTAGEFERFEAILTTTEGSAQNARKSLSWISDFAAKTPYELNDATDAFVKMRAYGLDPTNGLLATLGDTASAMGKDLSQAVEAIADAVTGENERLKEFGIKASKNKKTGNFEYSYTDKNGIQQLKVASAEDRQAIERALSEIWKEKYAGGMENLARTFEGQVAKLKDIWLQFKLAIMQHGLFDAIKQRLSDVADKIEALKQSGKFDEWAKKIGKGLLTIFDAAWGVAQTLVKLTATMGEFAQNNPALSQLITKMLGIAAAATVITGPVLLLISTLLKIGSAITMVTQMGSAMAEFVKVSKFISAMSMLPFIAALAAIAAIGLLIYQNWQPIKAFFTGLWQSFGQAIAPAIDSLKTAFAPIMPIIDSIIAGVSGLINALVSLFAPANLTKEQLSHVTTQGQAFGQTLGQMINVIGQVVAMLVSALSVAFVSVGTAIGTFVAMVQVHGGQVVDFMASLPGRFISFLDNLPSEMMTIGMEIIDGLKDGIISRVEAVVSTIQGVVAKVKSAFTGTEGMDIHSPSRVFASYGGHMMAGLDKGMASDAPQVIRRTQKLTDNIKHSLATPLNQARHTIIKHATSANISTKQPQLAAAANHGNQGNQGTTNITININATNDPHATARAVQQALAKEQAAQQARHRRRMMD